MIGADQVYTFSAVKKLDLTEYAKQNREVMTPSEKALWQYLRGRKLGVKFRSQQPVGAYILDFYSAEVRLGIEVDGQPMLGFRRTTPRGIVSWRRRTS